MQAWQDWASAAQLSPVAPAYREGRPASGGDLPALQEAVASLQPLAAQSLCPAAQQQALPKGGDAGAGRTMLAFGSSLQRL